MWADNYDRDLEDIFELQDELTMKLIDALNVELIEGEQWREWGGRTANIRALISYLQGIEYAYRLTKENNFQARKCLENAIELDPEYPAPHAWLGIVHLNDIFFGWSESPLGSFEEAEKFARKTLSLDDTVDLPHSVLSLFHLYSSRHDNAIKEGELAIALSPNGANAYAFLGFALVFSECAKEALSAIKRAFRLNPNPPGWYYLFLGLTYRVLCRYEEALNAYKTALDKIPNALIGLLGIASCNVLLGRVEEARKITQEILEIDSNFSLDFYAMTLPFKNQSDLNIYLDSLRKAGLS
jgi:adenylate cyclase